MHALVVSIFDDMNKADEARLACRKEPGPVVDCHKEVVAVRLPDGTVHLHYTHTLAADGALVGGAWGALVGLFFLNPLFGILVGAGVGSGMGALGDLGIDHRFIHRVGQHIKPGSSALFVPVAEPYSSEVAGFMQAKGATVLVTHVNVRDEAELDARIDALSTPEETQSQAIAL